MRARKRIVSSRRGSGNVSTKTALRNRTRITRGSGSALMSGEVIPYSAEEVVKDLLKGPQSGRFREDTHIHVSDLIYKCVRKIALSHRLGQPIDPEPIFDSQGITFKVGEAIHDYITEKVIHKHPSKVYGTWACVCGKTKEVGVRSDIAATCKSCGTELHKYHELRILDDELRLTGSVDLTMIIDSAFYLTEIKSKKHELWSDLVRPDPEHVIQILMYWYMAKRKGMSLHDKVSLLYATKNYIFNNPYKEFVICPSEVLHKLDVYLEDAEALRDSMHGDGPLPPRTCCPSAKAPAAKKCQFNTVCFAME